MFMYIHINVQNQDQAHFGEEHFLHHIQSLKEWYMLDQRAQEA